MALFYFAKVIYGVMTHVSWGSLLVHSVEMCTFVAMNVPENNLHCLIDKLSQSDISFSLYRLPWEKEPILVLQREGLPHVCDRLQGLNGKTGFVLAPFCVADHQPVILIRPDRRAVGWQEIANALEGVEVSAHQESDAESTLPVYTRSDYTAAFSRFIAPLRGGIFQKLVLSRCEDMDLPRTFSPLATFVNACNHYPRMMISLVHTPLTGTWIGSTPEIILSEERGGWHTVSLAGTMPMTGDTVPQDWSFKNREEQMLVSAYLRGVLQKIASGLTEEGPYTARAGQVVHLKTDFFFKLEETDNLGDIVYELHPTPAVCGLPKQSAYDFILANEGYNRSYYAGIIGWLDSWGEHTSLYVNLRCMQVVGRRAILYAGGGILASSMEENEWEETRHKMDTMRRIIC